VIAKIRCTAPNSGINAGMVRSYSPNTHRTPDSAIALRIASSRCASDTEAMCTLNECTWAGGLGVHGAKLCTRSGNRLGIWPA